MSQPIRVRFAPSPTGFLHVGGARTALFNWLWARKNDGQFILRIEDTDQTRSTQESTDQILESFQWLGIEWDEGPFFQSERLDLYRAALDQLIREGKAYPAFETKEELDAKREEAMKAGREPVYDRAALSLSPEEIERKIAAGVPHVYRLKAPESGYTEVADTNMGGEGARFENAKIGDFIITRPGTPEEPGWPLYNFCAAVDDHDMGITNVIRGVEHLGNAAKQILIMQALGCEPPTYTHLPLINKKGKKMSKRDADADPRFPVSVSGRRELGYLKEACLNFFCLLGWSHPEGEEIFPVDEAIKHFSLDRLQKSAAEFDEDKFLHQNAWYIRNLSAEKIYDLALPYVKAEFDVSSRSEDWLRGIMTLAQERARLLSEFPAQLDFFFEPPQSYEAKAVKKAFKGDAASILQELAQAFLALEDWTQEAIHDTLSGYAESKELGFGKVAQPCRIAVSGRMASPGLTEVLYYTGREETAARLRRAAELIEAGDTPVTDG